jgi:hypothetical protein
MWERPRIIAKGNDGGWVQRSSEGRLVGGGGSVAGVDLLRCVRVGVHSSTRHLQCLVYILSKHIQRVHVV